MECEILPKMSTLSQHNWTLHFETGPKVWMVLDSIDGTWVMLPLAIIGSALNAFMLWILRTKANLHTAINASISAECFARLVFCGAIFPFKAWILTISPLLGLSNLPSPDQCFAAAALSYLSSVTQVVFNLLTNVLRYLYLRASNSCNRQAIRISTLPRLQNKLLILGGILVGAHVTALHYAENDQFTFDQGCLRPMGKVKPILAPTLHLFQLLLVYFIPSSVMWPLILSYVISEKKRLNRSLQQRVKAPPKKSKRNLYSAGSGIAHVAVLVFFMMLYQLPALVAYLFEADIPAGLQSFMVELFTLLLNGVISPSIIFWSSSEARVPAERLMKRAWITITHCRILTKETY